MRIIEKYNFGCHVRELSIISLDVKLNVFCLNLIIKEWQIFFKTNKKGIFRWLTTKDFISVHLGAGLII